MMQMKKCKTLSELSGAIHKGCSHVRGEEGQAKVGKCGQEEEGWLAKSGRPLIKNYS